MLTPYEIISSFRKTPSKNAITYINVETSEEYCVDFHDLSKILLAGSNYLYKEMKLKEGETIAYLFDNSPEVVTLNLITLISGLTSCPLDSNRDTIETARHKLVETNAKILFFKKTNKIKRFVQNLKKDHKIKAVGISSLSELSTFFGNNTDKDILKHHNPDATSLVLYTSGTTGTPKGAQLTYRNLYSGAKQVGNWFQIGEKDKFYVVLPLYHINSTVFTLATLFNGGSLILSSRYSKKNYWKYAAKFGATMSSIVATINIDLLEEHRSFQKYNRKILFKRIQIGSAPVSPKHVLEFVKNYNIPLIQGYGSTETSLRVTGIPVDIPKRMYKKLVLRNSIGKALSENEVIIRNKEDQVINEQKVSGEITVKGENVTNGYLNQIQNTNKVLKDGYFFMGDIGYFEEINGEKYYYLKGRSKEIIIKGGVNISPISIEEKIRQHASWVRDAIVVGFPHFRYGEEIGLIVVPKSTYNITDFMKLEKDLKHFKVKDLSEYETPSVILLKKDKDISKTGTGKVQHMKVAIDFKKELINNYKHIGKSNKYTFRLITPDERLLLKKVVQMHNSTLHLRRQIDLNIITHRATNGIVIGAFDNKNNLHSTLSGFFTKKELLMNGENWSEITGKSNFDTAEIKGDTLVLVSISSINSINKTKKELTFDLKNLNITEKEILKYIKTKEDFVVKFYKRPKSGFKNGARVLKILPKGDLRDIESLGAVVLFNYQNLKNRNDINITLQKPGEAILEAAIKYAKDSGKDSVIALSRLGEFWKEYNQYTK